MKLHIKIYNYLYNRVFPINYARKIGVKIGRNCLVYGVTWPTEPYLITIGDNVQITGGVKLHTHGGAHVARSIYSDFDVFGKIVIKDGAYIGNGAQIMPGVTIGMNSLIAAGSIVCKSVPDNELWGGNPAKFICTVGEYIERNMKYNLNTKGLSFKEKRRVILEADESKFIKK